MGGGRSSAAGADGAAGSGSGPAALPGRGLFVTGTDTEIGKSLTSAALIHALRRLGLRVAGMKPVASGCVDGRCEDADALAHASGLDLPMRWVNPVAYEPAIAPHIAAVQVGRKFSLRRLDTAYAQLSSAADLVVVEGVGGWMVPLGSRLSLAELPRRWHLPVVLVVGLRLGCINHALLTARAIRADGCELLGWIANSVDPQMTAAEENLKAIAERIGAPCLGRIPHQTRPDPEAAADALDAALLRRWLRRTNSTAAARTRPSVPAPAGSASPREA